jgi:signal transduction histidine kinase
MGGSGLGLAICKEIVENHGGKIRAENVGSGGLQIEIEFPIIPGRQKH